MDYLLRGKLPIPPVPLRYARGSWLHPEQGEPILDACSGAICMNIGHAHPHVLAAMGEQALRFSYAHPGQFEPALGERLAQFLCLRTGRQDCRVLLSSTGTTAVELAITLARQYHRERGEERRVAVLSSWLSYHGSSALTLGLSGHRRRRAPLSYAPGVEPSFDPPYPGFHDRRHPGQRCSSACASAVSEAIERIGAERIAALLIEPITGVTGGARLPPEGYLDRVRAICDQAGILVIHDEVMVGLGRAGEPFAGDLVASQSPDLCIVSKGLGAGYSTISAVLLRAAIAETIAQGSGVLPLSGTMAGNPLSAATALAVMDVLDGLGLFEATSQSGKQLRERGRRLGMELRRELEPGPGVVGVRGAGHFWAVELHSGSLPAVLASARQHRLSLYPFNGYLPDGSGEGVLVAPPLTASDAELEFLVTSLTKAVRQARPTAAYAGRE